MCLTQASNAQLKVTSRTPSDTHAKVSMKGNLFSGTHITTSFLCGYTVGTWIWVEAFAIREARIPGVNCRDLGKGHALTALDNLTGSWFYFIRL